MYDIASLTSMLERIGRKFLSELIEECSFL
jgi:hypothetical protein